MYLSLNFAEQIRIMGKALFSRYGSGGYANLPFRMSPEAYTRSFSLNTVDFQSGQLLQQEEAEKKRCKEVKQSLAVKRADNTEKKKGCKEQLEPVLKFFSKFDPSVELKSSHLFGAYLKLSSVMMVKEVLAAAPHIIDGVKIDVRPLRPMNRTLFVGLLPANTALQTLQDYFSQFGEVEFCSQKRSTAMNRPLRAAYVTFSSVDGSSRTTLLLDHLPLSVTEEKLEKYFTKIGELIHCEIALEPSIRGLTGRVTFDNEEGVKKALVLGPHFIDGIEIRVNYHAQETTVLVENLAAGITRNSLIEHFRQFGAVFDCLATEGGASVSFLDMSGMKKALTQKTHIIDGQKVNVKWRPHKSLSASSSFVFETFHVQTLDDCWLPVPIARNIYFNDLRSTHLQNLEDCRHPSRSWWSQWVLGFMRKQCDQFSMKALMWKLSARSIVIPRLFRSTLYIFVLCLGLYWSGKTVCC
uniref:RRM domain-containing protein n=1 Tax=Ditylenchus dipsaci TaxID=166011 RepID=A0A915DH59_9BILA